MAEQVLSYHAGIDGSTITTPEANSHPCCGLSRAEEKTVLKYHLEKKKVAVVRPTFYQAPDPSLHQLRLLIQRIQLTE
jgi:hypothetical protein